LPAGAWVATQIDQYRSLGVGLKPDWVIFDPRIPDNHSGLDARADRQRHARCVRHLLECDVEGLGERHGVGRPVTQRRGLRLAVGVPQLQPGHAVHAGLRRHRFGNGGPTPIGGATRFEYSRLHIFRRRLHPGLNLAQEESPS